MHWSLIGKTMPSGLTIATAEVRVLAGNTMYPTVTFGYVNGLGTNAIFFYPYGVGISADGSYALISDFSNYAVRSLILQDLPTGQPTSQPTAQPSSQPTGPPTPYPTVKR